MANRSSPKTPPEFTPHATNAALDPPPLKGLRVLEFAGLAPGPFAGLLLADYGATVLRVDRPHPKAHLPALPNQPISRTTSSLPPPTPDLLARRKSSIAVNLKSQGGVELLKSLVAYHAIDVIIDPFRPGVLEAAGLDPDTVLRKLNPRVIVARLTGFHRDDKYAHMAGHDINYIAVSGVLSMLGRASDKPYPPANILGDFAGGGATAFIGILLALLQRERTGIGQIVEANMVDGSAYLATMPRLARKTPIWNGPRGSNLLDGGCPYYNTYETKDGKYMAVGALEQQFFEELLRGLSIEPDELPGPREERTIWPSLEDLFARRFRSKSQAEWMQIFNHRDACCTPVLTYDDLEEAEYVQRPLVDLKSSPALPSHDRDTWFPKLLSPGEDGERVLLDWTGGWKRGKDYELVDGGLVKSGRESNYMLTDRSKL